MAKLERFHKRAARYMSGEHIRRDANGNWSYPDHERILAKCQLLPISKYIERRRGTLRKYFEEHKGELLEEVEACQPPARDPHKVLWWRQAYIPKAEFRRLQEG